MGLIKDISGYFRERIVSWLQGGSSSEFYDRSTNMASRREYRLGAQKRFLRRSREGFDDNVIGNFLGLALDRGVSLLFGKPVKFEWEEGTPDDLIEYIEGIWEANNMPVLLHKLGMYGAEDGTVFVKLVPDYEKGWRIVPQDPIYKDIVTDPNDEEIIIRYVTQYKYSDENGFEIAKRETMLNGAYAEGASPDNWLIRYETASRETGGKWREDGTDVWAYPVPPIIHWQNLPMIGTTWGMPDISDDVIELQDKSNFNISNVNRIIRFFAHPFRWSRGFGGARTGQGATAEADTGPDKMPNVDSATAEIFQLDAIGDLPGAVAHTQNLRQMIFDITRNTDITSMKDKVGALTNFGLRILFFDALNKLETKRGLYGWGIREINRRIQIFSNLEPMDCEVIWEDPLPTDEAALTANTQSALNMGIISKETACERLGYNWEDEQKRMETEQAATDNIGAQILRAFERGGTQPNERVAGRLPIPSERSQ